MAKDSLSEYLVKGKIMVKYLKSSIEVRYKVHFQYSTKTIVFTQL